MGQLLETGLGVVEKSGENESGGICKTFREISEVAGLRVNIQAKKLNCVSISDLAIARRIAATLRSEAIGKFKISN